MCKVVKTFVCRGCVSPATGAGCTSVDIGVAVGLLGVNGDADVAVKAL